MTQKNPAVGCYYFPNYHPGDERNTQYHGPGWSEWEVVKHALPRFEGHRQPKKPLWGYCDESDPAVMAEKIDAAADHGIDYFLFDYYFYNDGPFLERCLNEGFLKAPNSQRLKFALMWANHDWLDIHPCGRKSRHLLYPGKVTPETFRVMCRRVIDQYFLQPNYFCIDGAPYFSLYHLNEFLHNFNSVEEARLALEEFRDMVRTAGLPGLHLNCVVWGNPVLPCEGRMVNMCEVVHQLGFDSVTSYVWIHHVSLKGAIETPYNQVRDAYFDHWEKTHAEYGAIPYFPNVTVGWDSSPRTLMSDIWEPTVGYPYMGTISENTPANFQEALRRCKERMALYRIPTMNINCWNEWTEGSMLEPEEQYGEGYLEAVKNIFGEK